jgi:hypothetical protein
VSLSGLGGDPQPRGRLTDSDLKTGFKILKKSLFVVNDLASQPLVRGAIIREWKKSLGLIPKGTI